MKFHCVPKNKLPKKPLPDTQFISLFETAQKKGVGSAGNLLHRKCRAHGLKPSQRAWDFLSLAISVVAADAGTSRKKSPDGWTRQIELTVSVVDHRFWNKQRSSLESLLGFLTG